MSTWHQRKAESRGVVYWHETLWTVLHDPPNDCSTLTRFNLKVDAEAYMERNKHIGNLLLIKPAKDK